MYDNERLGKILGDIERYFADLEEVGIKNVKDLENKKNFYSVSMLLFSIINRSIDLGEEIIAAKNLGTPSTYKDIFFLLFKGKLINDHMKKQLQELSSYRNIFSHNYHDFKEKDVFNALTRISVVRDFAKRMKVVIKPI